MNDRDAAHAPRDQLQSHVDMLNRKDFTAVNGWVWYVGHRGDKRSVERRDIGTSVETGR